MNIDHVTVFGGSGFLGRRLVERLVQAGATVRVAGRNPTSSDDVEAVRADVCDAASVARAVEAADAVVNAVGYYVESGGVTFDAVHGVGAGTVARCAAEAGAGRLVHLSGIGADATSPSAYVRSRAAGETRVREAFPDATILRPSVIFGPGDAMVTALAAVLRRLPVMPLFGRGETRLQPVFVGDVADAAARALAMAYTAGKTYELGGPDVYSYRALLELLCASLGIRRRLMPMPFVLWEIQAALASLLPRPPLTRDQVTLMRHDNVVADGAPGLADLGITPTALEAVLPTYL